MTTADEGTPTPLDAETPRAIPSGERFYPAWLRSREWWVNWVLAQQLDDDGEIDTDGPPTKQPVAPYERGDARPVAWNFGLDPDDHPATTVDAVEAWGGTRVGVDVHAPERVVSDRVGNGIIIPTGQRDRDTRTTTLLDWDDVRDPETGAIHPVCARALREADCYAEISQSGKGIHQFVFGEIPGGSRTFIRHIDAEPFVGDDRPQIEMYMSGRLCAMTGDHVDGTGRDVTAEQGLVDRLCWQFGTATNNSPGTPTDPYGRARDHGDARLDDTATTATADGDAGTDAGGPGVSADAVPSHAAVGAALREAAAYDGPDPETWERDGRSLDYRAVLEARARSDELPHIANWELIGYAAALGYRDGLDAADVVADLEAFPTPQYGFDPQRARSEVSSVYRKVENDTYGPPSRSTLVERGILPDREPFTVDGGGDGTDDGSATGARFGPETCDPPIRDAETFDREQRWGELQGARFDAALADDRLHLFADEAGSGKTTNAELGALARDEAHVAFFDKHHKAREFTRDPALPDDADHFHMKGSEQKRDGRCMDADHADEECPEHGHTSNCPSMCPVYDLDADHPTRVAFDALEQEVGTQKAHQILGLGDEGEHPWHGDECAWQAQYSAVESADNVLAVHPYMTQKSVRDGRLAIIDETPKLNTFERTYSVRDLARIANTLEAVGRYAARDDPEGVTAHHLAAFTRDVIDVLTDADGDAPGSIAELEPPTVIARAWTSYDDTAGHTVETAEPDDDHQLTESLARVKVAYGETVLGRMRRDEWQGAPLSLDAVLTAAAAAGIDETPTMQAVAVPPTLDLCPWCHGTLDHHNGAATCERDGCGWDERENAIIRRDAEAARATTWVEHGRDDAPVGLGYRELPLPSTLPDPANTIVLDATATPEKVACLFGIDPDDVHVTGNDPLDLPNLRVTQVLNGQFHGGTIAAGFDDAGNPTSTTAARIQRAIDTAGRVHRKPLYVVEKGLKPRFTFPENGEVIHYHATRGLNFNDCDAVVCIGAPHPNVTDLERDATLLAMGRDDVSVGGVEHSTRRDADGRLAANPPVYRKLHYTADDGRGLAVPTKHYTGLVGTLFREAREKELVQAVHRIRPLLADETRHAYLLTNVPTSLPVDTVCSFADLADPLEAILPVPEAAIDLLEAVRDTVDGRGPHGFRADQLVEQRDDGTIENRVAGFHRLARLVGLDVTERTVYNWVHALEDVGLLTPTDYEQRRGVAYTVDLSTLKRALHVLSGNGGFKVAAVRRFRALAGSADGSLDWLEWARDAFGAGAGDPGLDPPPAAGG